MRKGRRKVEHGSAARRLPPGDAELVRRARTGEHRAFNELIERYQRRAVCVAYRLVGNVHDALEVSQDSFVRAYQNLRTLADGDRFGPWLLRIVTNLALNFRRARRPRLKRQREWPVPGADEPDSEGTHVGRGDRPSSAMNTLELAQRIEAGLAELLACEGGCINGPAMAAGRSVSLYRQRLLAYAAHEQPEPLPGDEAWPGLDRTFRDRSQPVPEFTQDEINGALARVEKYSPQDELNCGACGYPSCREKAIAALRGMAELTMCIPYMRSRAESLTNVVMDSVPNAVLVVDDALHIQDASASALRMFSRHRSDVLGRPLRELVPDVSCFFEVQRTAQPVRIHRLPLHEALVVELTIVPVQGKQLLVAVLRDITEQEKAREALARLRAETLHRSQAVIKRQMRVAHEIAGLLGETTAETKVLLSQLARLLEEDAQGGTAG